MDKVNAILSARAGVWSAPDSEFATRRGADVMRVARPPATVMFNLWPVLASLGRDSMFPEPLAAHREGCGYKDAEKVITTLG